MKRYEANSICPHCKGFLENNHHEVVRGKWIKYSDHKAENKKLLEALEELFGIQTMYYGYATDLHLAMGDFVDKYQALKDGE